jgi:hypothetical protein
MRKFRILVFLLLFAEPLLAQKTPKSEAVTPEPERTASDAHSFMELFSKLERDFGLSVLKRDQTSLEAFLAPEFVERDAANPDQMITKAQWLARDLKLYNLDPLGIRSMTIRAFVRNAVVSFVQKQRTDVPASGRSHDYVIVDVWVINHGRWQLASRTVASAACDN